MKNSGTENGDSVVQIFWKKLFDSKSSFPCMGIFTNRGGSSRNPKFFEDLLKTTVFKNVLKTLWTTTPLFSGLVLVKIKRCCSNLHSVEKKETLRSRYVQLLAVESWLPFLLWISNYIGVWIPDVLETAQIQYHVFICCVWLLPMPFFLSWCTYGLRMGQSWLSNVRANFAFPNPHSQICFFESEIWSSESCIKFCYHV